MSTVGTPGEIVSFIWSVADLLRGDFKAHEFGQIILPFTVLRRLECALEPTKPQVVARAESLAGKVDNVDPILQRAAGQKFYNTSPLDLTKVLADPGNAAKNLSTYVTKFSPGATEVLERYGFADKITRLDKAGLLYQIVAKFADLDLTQQAVSNESMGHIFEELLRKFSEMSNETAGEHFTPREVIELMVNLLFAEDDEVLAGAKPVRTMYDPACGTGGMLTGAQNHLRLTAPDAVLEVFGQELNPETWAICRSDLMIKGDDPSRIVLGNSLTGEDGYPGQPFDYMLANPPFGVDWKKYADPIIAERDGLGDEGRYGPGVPRVSDGSLLFLLHMLSKMKPVSYGPGGTISGGTRLAIVFSGSPLFAGAAGGGESEIRRWIIENDYLEGIVALPDQLFYNTGISTYFWILSNRKNPQRRGKIVLLDARESFTKMRKSLGDKRKYISTEQTAEITKLYDRATEPGMLDKRVKIFSRETFGYQRVIVERPLRRRWELVEEGVEVLVREKVWAAWLTPPRGTKDPIGYVHQVEEAQPKLLDALKALIGHREATEAGFKKRLGVAVPGLALIPANIVKAIVAAATIPDPAAPIITDSKGKPLPDPDLRDAENIGLSDGYLSPGVPKESALVAQADDYLRTEIHPYAPDAWIDHNKTKIGYEIPITRHFYEYIPPRPVAEIDTELDAIEAQIKDLLGGLAR